MRTYMKRKITETKIVERSRICNCCGKEFIFDLDNPQFTHDIEETVMQFKLEFGYFSNGKDMTSWTFDLCEQCIEDFVKTFKIAPLEKEEFEAF
jgi:hypothetical protein